ncbi:MAG: ATP-dependent DNA ligase [Nanoarchaeota archaeon]
MEYLKLVKIYKELEATTKKLEKTEIIAKVLKEASAKEIANLVYLIEGRVFPEWDERKIGFSDNLIIKSIARASGEELKNVKELFSKKGDLGLVAEELLKKKKQSTLEKKSFTTDEVIENIRKLTELSGEGTVEKKIGIVTELLTHTTPEEANYIVKFILEQLRIGVAEGIVRDAIAKAFNKNIEDVEKAFDLTVDYGKVAEAVKSGRLGSFGLTPGRPLKLMLAILVENINEGFEALGKPIQLEFKIDGFRLEVHKKDNEIRLFTRRMEDVTKQFPEAVEYVKKYVKGNSFILDCEVAGINKKTGRYRPFQEISQRIKRKYNIEEMVNKLPVELNIFDVIYYNGKSLMNETLRERRTLLEKIVDEVKGKIVLTKKLVTSDEKEANKFFKKALASGVEGVMLKNLKSTYKPGRYVGGWCKLKSVLEPLDLAIVKAEYGEGKRAKTLSSYTVACQKDGELLEIGKVSTGVKEKAEGVTYEKMTKLLKPLIIKEDGKEVTVRPKIVIEVGYEEIQKSPSYSSGYALRFPRVFLLREEKPIDEISDIKIIERIYKSQRGKKK